MVEASSTDNTNLPQRILMAAALGLPLFTALVLWSEKQQWNRQKSFLLQLGGVALLSIYFFSLPYNITEVYQHFVRFALFSVGLHFLVAFLPYLKNGSSSGFWQYNKTLFLRFLVAALYSAVMYIGLAIALASADHLFGIEVKWERYFELWIILSGVFQTWVFLAGIPSDLSSLDSIDDYPKGLKVFTQYILLPLVTLYIVILFAYEAKIIFTWNWPKGWVSQLVLWYSVVGILSLLLLHPLRDRQENRWIKVFSNWFFWGLVPLVIMLFLAIARRISDYGITENRYLVLAMAVGLAIVVIYFIVSKIKDIRIIPIVICSIAFLSSFGPWGAFSVSLNSQRSRLDKFLNENELLAADSIQTSKAVPSLGNRKEMSSIVNYLINMHGTKAFSKWIDDSTLSSLDTLNKFSKKQEVAKLLGFEQINIHGKDYQGTNQSAGTQMFYYLGIDGSYLMQVSDYDYLIYYSTYSDSNIDKSRESFELKNNNLTIYFDSKKSILEISLESNKNDKVEFLFNETIQDIITSDSSSIDSTIEYSFMQSGDKFDAKVFLQQMYIESSPRDASDKNDSNTYDESIEPDRSKSEHEIVVTLISAKILIRIH